MYFNYLNDSKPFNFNIFKRFNYFLYFYGIYIIFYIFDNLNCPIKINLIKIFLNFYYFDYNMAMKCFDCPRNCGVDRRKQIGYCGEKENIKIAKIIENFMWEEPCISGEKGTLAIFFSGCNLRCEFCQNYEISHKSVGREYTPNEFYRLLLSYDLDRFSCIELITPTHFSSQILKALDNKKLPIPVVWNSSGYEKPEKIEKLAKVVDVFMPDFKYFSSELAKKYSRAEDYFNYVSKSIVRMRELKSTNIFDNDGVLQSGLLIRLLVLPGNVIDSIKILDFIKENISEPQVSIMSQFTPCNNSSISRKLYPLEYKTVVAHARKLGLTNGYIQDFASASENFIPKF